MAFDKATRNRLQKFVSEARKLLSEEFTQQLQNTYGLDPNTGAIAELSKLPSLSPSEQQTAKLLRDTLEHYLAAHHKADPYADKTLVTAALDRIVREQAFTVLNRLAALRMAEARQFVMESISQGYQSKGFQLYQRIAGSALGETGQAYQCYLFSVFDELSLDLAVLFDRYSSQGRLFPRETVLLELLDLINHAELELLWVEDETVGWIYQYFNSKEERKKMRDESQAPRNSRELAVRNQFFTPRYVVEFLTDNTLGRIWYEMTKGKTTLVDSCQYLVRRPNEIFLEVDQQAPEVESDTTTELSQEELLQQTVYIQHRPLQDPRDIKMLDPACGSMHFGLYAFDLFENIYSEAWDIEASESYEKFGSEDDSTKQKQSLHQSYESKERFLTDVPRLILEHNIHGVDIDPRAVQIAGLSLWLRAQKSWADNGIKPNQRPQIQRSNIVCAEPMPGEKELLKEFTSQIQPRVLGQLVEVIFDKMQLAGEAGTLLKIEKEIQSAIEEAKSQKDEGGHWEQGGLFGEHKREVRSGTRYNFDGEIGEGFWDEAEYLILSELKRYAESATGEGSGQKRLFAADAAKGFAFIDLCRKRFDVVLMNPPFGDPSKDIKKLLSGSYIGQPNDLYSCFIERSINDLCIGKSGYVTPREFINYSSFKNLRKLVIYPKSRIELFSDFGLGVMDDAMVRAAVYVIECSVKDKDSFTPFFRLIGEKDKSGTLLRMCGKLNQAISDRRIYLANQLDFVNVGEGSLAYWISKFTISRFSGELFEDRAGDVRLGVQTANNFQFLRLSSEVSRRDSSSRRWRAYLKGGEFQKYFNNVHMLVDWREGGEHILKSYGSSVRLRDVNQYEREGLNYPLINEIGINVGILPKRAVFDNGSPSIYPYESESPMVILGLINSRFAELCFRCLTSTRHWQVGYLRKIPWCYTDREELNNVEITALRAAQVQQILMSEAELSLDFVSPLAIRMPQNPNIEDVIKSKVEYKLNLQLELLELDYSLDKSAEIVFGVTDEERLTIQNVVGVHPCELPKQENGELSHHRVSLFDLEDLAWKLNITPREILEDKTNVTKLLDIKSESLQLLSYFVGCLMGRWDEKVKVLSVLDQSSLFAERRVNNLALGQDKSNAFLLENEFGGKFLHELKITLSAFYGSNSELVYSDLESLADINYLKYFSNPNGFFKYHLNMYTKSQRQAPVYWPLQSEKCNFTIWIYFHEVDNQTLFACVNNCVEGVLGRLSSEIDGFNKGSEGDKGLSDERSKLQSLEFELSNFRDELLRVAGFWRPNTNDGVQLVAAPLWKLFQNVSWREKLRRMWIEIENGKHDWSYMAYTTCPERVIRKCHQDRSIAIAHEVEADLWEEITVPATRGKGTKLVWQPKKMSGSELDAYIQLKIAKDK